MGDIQRPVYEVRQLLEGAVAQGLDRGMSEEDVRLWLATLARDEYRRQAALRPPAAPE